MKVPKTYAVQPMSGKTLRGLTLRTLCEVGDSEENFSCEDDTTTLWRSGATTTTAPVRPDL